ncbi:hypothetical protein BJ165DRAFT_1466511 [Panaeolus papilionaceus]|nr:hypothetical protein BJ165DRAFT_1466511 [Panaeolus papilionaceus]
MSRTRTERVSTSTGQDTKPKSTTRRRPARQQPPIQPTTTSTTPTQTTQNLALPAVFTFSQFLGNLAIDQPAFSGARLPRSSNAATDAYRTYAFDSSEPGPSRFYDRSNPTFVPQDFIVDQGWSVTVDELSQGLRGTRIEEVDEEIEDEGVEFTTPRPRNAAGRALNGGRHLRQDYETVSRATHTASSSKPTAALAAMYDSRSRTPILDEFTEVELVRENNILLDSALEDMKFMNTFFLSRPNEYDVSQHIDCCTEIEKSLKSLLQILRKRLEISSEEWNVHSEAWYQKYCKRLFSLRITLQRLIRLRQLVESHTFRPSQQNVVLSKLEQHEAKLADLTSKFTMGFKRLTLCHLHYLLNKSHKEAQELLELRSRNLSSKASFERKWVQGKQFRASLREAFQDIHPQLYNNSQQSRRSTNGP